MQRSLTYKGYIRAFRRTLTVCAMALLTCSGVCQNTPLISGGIGFLTERNQGDNMFQPIIMPVLAAPIGNHLLVEARGSIDESWLQNANAYPKTFLAGLTFLQLDYLANPHLTLVAGKFLTPFGTYNERLTPIWIPNFQDAPISFGIGTRTSGSSNGGMARGVVFSNPTVQLNYVGYFSGTSNAHEFKAARTAGSQVAFYFPKARLEIGSSYQRFLQGTHNNSYGFHVWWLPPHSAYELRSEYVVGARSQGYWIENAYRFSRFGGPDSFRGRFEPVFRMQQTFRNQPNFPGQGDGLPAVDTQQLDFGFNYHLPHELRFNSSYSRAFATPNKNIWAISLTYRFLFPAWRGHQ